MTTINRFAEEANYWDTTVHPAKSQGEIVEILDDFGVENQEFRQGVADGRTAWLVRFEWRDMIYRFVFTPLECKRPELVKSWGGKRRSHADQAKYQMGRIAKHFVKALLTAAETTPLALFGFAEIPGTESPTGLPMTAGEFDPAGLANRLPPLRPLLTTSTEGEKA